MTDVGELDKLLARGFIPNFIDPEQEKKLKELEAMLKNPANKVAKGPKKGHWKLEQKDAMLANARTLYAGIMGKAIPPSTKDPRAAIGLAREAYKSMSDPTVGVGGGGLKQHSGSGSRMSRIASQPATVAPSPEATTDTTIVRVRFLTAPLSIAARPERGARRAAAQCRPGPSPRRSDDTRPVPATRPPAARR